jgi:hypothetical protein
MADMKRKGRAPRGERSARAKLTRDAVREIRALASAGHRQAHIAPMFGVVAQTVSRIVRGDRWGWLE